MMISMCQKPNLDRQPGSPLILDPPGEMVGEVRVVVGENVRANLRTLCDFMSYNWNEKILSALLLCPML